MTRHRPLRRLLVGLGLLLPLGCRSVPPSSEGTIAMTDGASLHYRMIGSGPDTVLVLHGGPGFDMTYLADALRPLARTRTLIFYDQRGRGRSSLGADRSPPTLDTDLRDLDEVRRHFRLERVVLVGHHYGAAEAALYAERYPERVARLAMISPLYLRHNYVYDLSRVILDSTAQARFWSALAEGRDTADPKAFCREFWGFSFTPAVVATPSVVHRLASSMCADSSWTFRRREALAGRIATSFGHRWDWRPTLVRIQAPTLVVHGTLAAKDALSSDATRDAILWHSTETWAALVPTARLIPIKGPSLFPWLGDGREFRRDLGTFLDGQWPAGAHRIPAPPPSPT